MEISDTVFIGSLNANLTRVWEIGKVCKLFGDQQSSLARTHRQTLSPSLALQHNAMYIGYDVVSVRRNVVGVRNDTVGVGNDIVSVRNVVANIRDSCMGIDCKFGLNANSQICKQKKVVQHTLNT